MLSVKRCLIFPSIQIGSKKENIFFEKGYLVLYNKMFGGDYNQLF